MDDRQDDADDPMDVWVEDDQVALDERTSRWFEVGLDHSPIRCAFDDSLLEFLRYKFLEKRAGYDTTVKGALFDAQVDLIHRSTQREGRQLDPNEEAELIRHSLGEMIASAAYERFSSNIQKAFYKALGEVLEEALSFAYKEARRERSTKLDRKVLKSLEPTADAVKESILQVLEARTEKCQGPKTGRPPGSNKAETDDMIDYVREATKTQKQSKAARGFTLGISLADLSSQTPEQVLEKFRKKVAADMDADGVSKTERKYHSLIALYNWHKNKP